jgi:tRNA threonylcarbamoyladenosine biosynthesis protein TsaB
MTAQPPATLLAFDTATERLSVALCARGQVWSHDAAGGARASAELIPAILALLAQGGVALRELDAIVFGRGPGAFTGLRTACSVAQGLAFGAGKPVLPIDTLLAIAEDARAGRAEPRRVWAAIDARMGEIYAAQYAFDGTQWSVLEAPMLTTPQRLDAIWRTQPPQCVAGNALVAFGAQLDTGGAQRVPDAQPHAVAMLPLAGALWAQGGAVDAALALPLYLRDKVAQTTLEREAARAAKDALEPSR